MESGMSRVVIETIARKAIKDIKASPKRSTRNVIDMALQFVNGRFQQEFFREAQTMLENENSAYYRLVYDTVTHVDTERLLHFGMNLGYNSCTLGAKTIREWEEKAGFNIPWIVTFEVEQSYFQKYPNRYQKMIEEGEELGIFTWGIFIDSEPKEILSLIELYQDSAFFLCCEADMITEEFVKRILPLDNVVIVVRYGAGMAKACDILRQNRMLYGVYHIYTNHDVERIISGELFKEMEKLHPHISILVADITISDKEHKRVYQEVISSRKAQKYQTVIWELYGDNCYVDEIISGDSCLVCFDKEGNLYGKKEGKESMNLFYHTMEKILMNAEPK